MITFEILGQPQGKARPRVTIRGGFAHAYTPRNTVEYEDEIRDYYRLSSNEFIVDKPLAMDVKAYYACPKGFQRKRGKRL